MSRRAHVDLIVSRAELAQPGYKAEVRMHLFERLAEMGQVESVERFVLDPPDGPYRDGSLGSYDWDKFALVRVIARVIPIAKTRLDHTGGLLSQ